MTFEERCERFVKNSKNEHNKFRFVYRVIFLNKKIQDYENGNIPLENPKERLGDLKKYRKMI